MKTTKLERAYETFVTCREVIRSSESDQQMFDEVCNTAVLKLGYRLAWMGLVDKDKPSISPVAQAGYEEGYLKRIDIQWDAGARSEGPTGRAFRERRPAICQDIATDSRFAPWREDAMRRGYASSAALPIYGGSACIGTFNLYAAEPDAFDDDEIALLEELTTEMQIGIQHQRLKAQLDSMNVQFEQVLRAEVASSATLALGHDMSNSLQIIVTSLEFARRGSDEASRAAALDDASEAAQSLVTLFRQIFSLNRRSAPTDLSTEVDRLLKGTAPLLTRLAPSATLELRLDASGTRTKISSIDLERLVINLVINASHAMPTGGRLTIVTDERVLDEALETHAGVLAPGRYLSLSVIDEGQGIDPAILPRIFEPFFTTKSEQGTGLGLSAVRTIVQGIGGSLEVESELGKGTKVTVLLPLL